MLLPGMRSQQHMLIHDVTCSRTCCMGWYVVCPCVHVYVQGWQQAVRYLDQLASAARYLPDQVSTSCVSLAARVCASVRKYARLGALDAYE